MLTPAMLYEGRIVRLRRLPAMLGTSLPCNRKIGSSVKASVLTHNRQLQQPEPRINKFRETSTIRWTTGFSNESGTGGYRESNHPAFPNNLLQAAAPLTLNDSPVQNSCGLWRILAIGAGGKANFAGCLPPVPCLALEISCHPHLHRQAALPIVWHQLA